MKNKIGKIVVWTGSATSLIYLPVFALRFLPYHTYGAWFDFLRVIFIFGLLGSIIAFPLTLAALVGALLMHFAFRKRLILLVINGTGVFITGLFILALYQFWKMGPINPG